MRKRLYEVIEVGKDNDKLSRGYDFFMMLAIIVSIVPLCTHSELVAFDVIDKVTVVIFIIDYLLRFVTADHKLKRGWLSFLIYPFSVMAIIDLLSILPSGIVDD